MIRTALATLLVLVAALTSTAALELTPDAQATIAVRVDVEEMAQVAEVIALCEVVKTESRWTDDGYRIVTEVTVRVTDGIWQSEAGDELTFVTLGGVVGDLAQTVAGEAYFQVGEETLVFLERRGGGQSLGVVGMKQGKFHVERPEGGTPVAIRALDGLSLATLSDTPSPVDGKLQVAAVEEPIAEPFTRPLPELLDAVRAVVSQRVAR